MPSNTPNLPFESGSTAKDGPASANARVVPVRPYLFLVLESDRPRAGGARYALSDVDEVVIGRAEHRSVVLRGETFNQLSVGVPGRSMSSVHASLRRSGKDWILEDLESTNGTFVNGSRVSSVTLCDGDVIELGHSLFTLRLAVPSPAGSRPILDSVEHRSPTRGFATLLPELEARYVELKHVASSKVPIALSGHSGTGKEVVAQAIHELSGRHGRFVAVNCGALPSNLLESLLFGHVKGAFSGAVSDKAGFVRASHEGTLFLDEVGELSRAAQVALLRVLQQSEVIPVGAERPISVDLRVVTATHEPLGRLVARGSFREDLQARIEGFTFHLPDLAERREDLGVLLASLLEGIEVEVPALVGSMGRRLLEYGWPLNVRELEQILRRAATLARGAPLGREHLPPSMHGNGTAQVRRSTPPREPADDSLRRELQSRLERCQGNVSATAEAMGKDRKQIQRWIHRLGIELSAYRK